MIIEIPILMLVCMWLWKRARFKGDLPKATSSAFSANVIMAHAINLIWLAFVYPQINIAIDCYFILFMCCLFF
ncbi:hypothetical protein ACWJKU_10900 [Methylocaldum sp. MU1018]